MSSIGMTPVKHSDMSPSRKLFFQTLFLLSLLAALALTPASALNGNAAASKQGFLVLADQTTLTVALEDADLDEVLKSIADQAGFVVEIVGKNKQRTLTEKFDDVPIAEGLDQLLRDVNYAIVYSNTGSPRRIERIFLLSDKKATPGGPVSTRKAPVAGAKQGKSAPPQPLTPQQIIIDPTSGRTLEDALREVSKTQSEVIIPELLKLKSGPLPDSANQPPQPIESLIQDGSISVPNEIESVLRGERQ